MDSSKIIIVVLSCALVSILLGLILYRYSGQIRKRCGRICHSKSKMHNITVPTRPSGEDEIVLAVTQRRETVSRNGSIVSKTNNTVVNSESRSNNYQRPRPFHHLVSRHHSFVSQQSRRPTYFSGSDVPSPLLSLSSLQSLLMSSQVAVFNSSTERLSLSSQTQNQNFQLISLNQQQNIHGTRGLEATSPFSISPSVSTSCVHLPQPSYFDEPPPSYQESMFIRKLRASERITGNKISNIQQLNSNFNTVLNSSSSLRFSSTRRSCRT